jgi:ankyrin repeat protein
MLPSEVAIQVRRHAESEFIYLFTVYKLRGRIRKFIKLSLLSVVAKWIMEKRHDATPMHMAVHWDKIDVLRVLLEHDWSLGYVFDSVASRGHIGAARELLKHCPDAPYAPANGIAQMLLPQMLLPNPQIVLPTTCLHQAIKGGHMELLEFFLGSKHLRKLVNMRDYGKETPLHEAVRKCDPKICFAATPGHRRHSAQQLG